MEPVALPACEVACPPRPREHELEPVPGPVGPARQHPRPLHVSLPEAPEIVEQADAVRVRVVLARRIVLEGKTINGEEKGGGEEEEEGYCMMISREKKTKRKERGHGWVQWAAAASSVPSGAIGLSAWIKRRKKTR